MSRAHALVKLRRARIGLDRDPDCAEIPCPGRGPPEQQAANARSEQGRLDKELHQIGVAVDHLELGQTNDDRVAFSHLEVRGPQLIGMERQFASTGAHERLVIAPNGL